MLGLGFTAGRRCTLTAGRRTPARDARVRTSKLMYAPRGGTHTVFSTGCSSYFDWQSAGLAYSHRRVNQRGPLTRLLSSCEDEAHRARALATPGTSFHEHPNFGLPEVNGVQDLYPPYNKPGGIAHWLREAAPPVTAEFILVLEADMVLRSKVDCATLGVRPGRAISSRYDYLYGVSNGMAHGFIKSQLAQPVGGWVCIHRHDLERVAPLWLELTKEVRKSPQRYWHMPTVPDSVPTDLDTGDSYAKHGRPPFIADMYGYSFAASELGISHIETTSLMIYAGQTPDPTQAAPLILHYGLWCEVPISGESAYRFSKLSYIGRQDGGFDPHVCEHYFPPPPEPRKLIASFSGGERDKLGSALLCAEVSATLNAALC